MYNISTMQKFCIYHSQYYCMVFLESKSASNTETYRWAKGGFSPGDVAFSIKLRTRLLFNCLLTSVQGESFTMNVTSFVIDLSTHLDGLI